jgi:uncharacterized protein YecT (DUF1311 family)
VEFRYLLLASRIASPLAHATSFDCEKASTYVEKTICSSPVLGKLDDALSEHYREMLATDLGDGPDNKALKKEQRVWVAQRNKCTTEKCLVDMPISRCTFGQSGVPRGTGGGYSFASSATSSLASCAGNGQSSPASFARCRYCHTVAVEVPIAWAISR